MDKFVAPWLHGSLIHTSLCHSSCRSTFSKLKIKKKTKNTNFQCNIRWNFKKKLQSISSKKIFSVYNIITVSLCFFSSFFFLHHFHLFLQTVFQVTPLTVDEWITVMKFSIPVVLLDEVLKFAARKISDGTNPLYTLHWIVLMWAVYFGLLIYGPF